MRRKRTAVLILLECALLLCASLLHAQSLFGVNFIGEHRFPGSARHRALGLSAIAVPDTSSAVTQNIATIADHRMVTFSIFEVLGMSRMKSETEVVDQNRFQLPVAMITVPLGRGFVFGVGYRTRFEGRGDFSVTEQLAGAADPIAEYKRRISLFTAPLTLAWKPADGINIAGELQIERGSIRDDISKSLVGASAASALSQRRRSYSGTSWAAAAIIRVVPRLYMGAFFDDRTAYAVDEEFSYSQGELDSTDTWDFTLPMSFGIGLSFGLSERWWLSSSYWSREAPEPAGFAHLSGSIGDEWLAALGVERRGAAEGGFFARMPLRFGFYVNRWHLQYPAGNPINARFAAFGTGFPMPGGPGVLDLSIEIGQIGSSDDNMFSDRVVRFGLGMNVSEQWSKRREGRR
jgi:hypothetical protein